MLYARINDAKEVLQFPLWDKDIRAMFPDTSFPPGDLDDVDLSAFNIVHVEPTATANMPTPSEGMRLTPTSAVWNEDQTKLLRVYSEVPLDVGQGGE